MGKPTNSLFTKVQSIVLADNDSGLHGDGQKGCESEKSV